MTESYLRRRGTNVVLQWTPIQAQRPDMIPISQEERDACVEAQKRDGQIRAAKAVETKLNAPAPTEIKDMLRDELIQKADELKIHVGDKWKTETIRRHIYDALKQSEEIETGMRESQPVYSGE